MTKNSELRLYVLKYVQNDTSIFLVSCGPNEMEQTTLSTYSILDLIPQRPPVVCVGQLTEVTETIAKSRFVIPAAHCFVINERYTAAGLMENVAQTAAARAGYLALESGQPITLGFIASFKNVVCNDTPAVDSCIETEITFMQTVLNMTIFSATISQEQNEIFSCEIRILIES